MSAAVLVETRGRIAILTLNAPARRNAISTAMRQELLATLVRLMASPECGALVLTGAAETFCAGGDISEMGAAGATTPPGGASRIGILHDVIRQIVFGGRPVVAAVEGVAAGAGMSLATACDCVIAAEDARFIAAFARMGLIADCALLWSLPRRVGPARALDILMSARTVTGVEAGAIGLADAVVAPGRSIEAALARAEAYLSVAPLALAAARRQLLGSPDHLEAALATELALQDDLRATEDHVEARRAFLEKRTPMFRGR